MGVINLSEDEAGEVATRRFTWYWHGPGGECRGVSGGDQLALALALASTRVQVVMLQLLLLHVYQFP